MSRRRRTRLWLALALGLRAASAEAHPVIDVQDAGRFFDIYDRAGGHPSAEQLQHDYLDRGSSALREFAKMRNISGGAIAAAIEKSPDVYDRARECTSMLPRVGHRLEAAFRRLRKIYPQAHIPPVIVLIGRNNTGGTTSRSGVLLGAETICSTLPDADRESGLVHLIAHEYGHVQQAATESEPSRPTLLYASLVEGGAEFIAELISGETGNPRLKTWAKGQEEQVETDFSHDEQSVDLGRWLWNGPSTTQRPADLGYWVGYRITKAFYLNSRDKCEAIRQIFAMADARAFLDRSGWHPGVRLSDSAAPLPASCGSGLRRSAVASRWSPLHPRRHAPAG